MRSNRLRSSREGLEAVGVSKAGGNRRLGWGFSRRVRVGLRMRWGLMLRGGVRCECRGGVQTERAGKH